MLEISCLTNSVVRRVKLYRIRNDATLHKHAETEKKKKKTALRH